MKHPAQPLVLFVCRHGAAKSALAAELARREATALGMSIQVEARGLDPEAAFSPQLEVVLPGFEPGGANGAPKAVTADDLRRSMTIVTFDLDPEELPERVDTTRWDGLPALSEDPLGARIAIEERVAALLRAYRAD